MLLCEFVRLSLQSCFVFLIRDGSFLWDNDSSFLLENAKSHEAVSHVCKRNPTLEFHVRHL